MTPRFGVGTQFVPVGNKSRCVFCIVDIFTTTNMRGIPIQIEYLCEHSLAGQKIVSRECETTIARGICHMQDLIDKGQIDIR